MSQPARLIARYGPFPRREFALVVGTTTIGRDAINDIPLDDSEVSRRHARIQFSDGRYIIEDLGSTNGTFVNGVAIAAPTLLEDGVAVDFGETQRFSFEGPEAEAAAPPAGYQEVTLRDPAPDYGATAIDAPAAPQAPAPLFDPTLQHRPRDTPTIPQHAAVEEALPTMMDARAVPSAPPPTIIAAPDPAPAPAPAAPEAPAAAKPRRTGVILLGCLFALLLVALVVGVTLFVLDAAAPDLLYCGVLKPVAELLADAGGRTLVCP